MATTIRPATAVDPLRFGRRSAARCQAQTLPESAPGDDLRLFATTFVAGFVFISILLG